MAGEKWELVDLNAPSWAWGALPSLGMFLNPKSNPSFIRAWPRCALSGFVVQPPAAAPHGRGGVQWLPSQLKSYLMSPARVLLKKNSWLCPAVFEAGAESRRDVAPAAVTVTASAIEFRWRLGEGGSSLVEKGNLVGFRERGRHCDRYVCNRSVSLKPGNC